MFRFRIFMPNQSATFSSLGLSAELLQTLEGLNYVTPSPIQEQTIPWMLQSRDVVGQAQTGTGKTAAFALPILQSLILETKDTQALILTPTRELSIQVAEHFAALGSKLRGMQVVVLCGGQDYRPQLKKLREGAHIVVGTPGRILDHISRGTLKLEKLRTFVLDEADEMLRMGFIEDVETILSSLPAQKQMALFSATMPSRIRQIAQRYLKDPVSVEIRSETTAVKNIEQRFLFAAQAQKNIALLRILAYEDFQGLMIFVRTKLGADEVANFLQQQGYGAMAIHGDLSQPLRERIIMQFKQGTLDILVATDVAARGLDVERVTHVINYDIAQDCETYIHRIGRTGRAGRNGTSILFVTPKESRMLNTIERHIKQRIEKINVPNDEMIQMAKQKRFLARVTERLNHEHLPSYQRMVQEYLKQSDMSPVDMAAVLALLLNQDKSWEEKLSANSASFIQEMEPSRSKRDREKDKRGKLSIRKPMKRDSLDKDYVQELFRLDVGLMHGVKPANIVGAIANEAGLQSRFITGLKIHEDHSVVRLPKGMPKEVIHGLNKAWVCGRQLKIRSLGVA